MSTTTENDRKHGTGGWISNTAFRHITGIRRICWDCGAGDPPRVETCPGKRKERFLYEGVEAGTEPIDDQIAAALAHGTQIPATLWLNLERIFRAGLAEGKTWTK